MRSGLIVAFLVVACVGYAEHGVDPPTGAEEFIREVVKSLIEGGNTLTVEVADEVFTIDNGEVLSREDLKRAWPDLAKRALKKKVTVDEFFRDVTLQVSYPGDNKRLMSDKRVLDVYTPQPGDLYCDASRIKDGMENPIGYEKAFVYIIRKVEGRWTLIGIGG